MRNTVNPRSPLIGFCLFFGATASWAQGPSVPIETAAPPGRQPSSLGPSLGDSSGLQFATPGADEPVSGRVGPSVPRVPSGINEPGQRPVGVPEQERITAPAILLPGEIPSYGPLALPSGREDEGPAGGLTLDQAIERLVHENLGIRARSFELPQADADILTASLRANPLLYADSQLIPYGSYSRERPGGPLQYDVNITYPLDVTHKRRARTLVARRARRVLEAQYQDAVRLQIDNLYTAYTAILGARETIRFAIAVRDGLAVLLDRTRRMYEKGSRTIADVSRIEALFEAAEVEVMDAEESLRTAKRNLGVLLNLPANEAEAVQLRSSIRDVYPPPPPMDSLVRMALDCRPDVAAYRLAILRAEGDVRLAQANRMSDLYLLYQPYTFQNNVPFDRQSATSWCWA